ncbi:MAG: SDR family NAD(P)-dependent oxidoreductase [Flavobacteriales bacterium]
MERLNTPTTYALITGGGTGIGQAVAKELAGLGYNLALVALPDSGLSKTKNQLEKEYSVAVNYLEIDLTETEAQTRIVDWISEEGYSIQVLVNNAGMGFAKSFQALSSRFINALLAVNVSSTTLLTHALLPHLLKHPKAYILNISSAAAFYSMPYKSVYAASKRYVMDFSMALREELKEHNVHVTAVCPAGVITSSEIRERINKSGLIARKSALEPEQVAREAVKALLKNKAYVVPGRLARMISNARYFVPASWQRVAISRSFKKKT